MNRPCIQRCGGKDKAKERERNNQNNGEYAREESGDRSALMTKLTDEVTELSARLLIYWKWMCVCVCVRELAKCNGN